MYFLCFSRIFQGAAASVLWITSLATLADTVGSGNMGKTMGIIGPIASSGVFFGPMTGGLLLSSVGYWHTWLVAVTVISLDLILRLAMIDRRKSSPMAHGADAMSSSEAGVNTEPGTLDPDKHLRSSPPATSHVATLQSNSSCSTMSSSKLSMPNTAPTPSSPTVEATPLLPTFSHNQSSPSPTEPLSNAEYFLYILRQRRVFSSMLITIILTTSCNSFDATLGLHVQEVFHWGPLQVGLLYLALLGPSVLLGPFTGWLRDSIGVWWPTLVGTGLATPLYVLIGFVGDERFHWMQGESGKRICIVALSLMGIAIELSTGTCIIEGARMSSAVLPSQKLILLLILIGLALVVIDELEARNPGIFGTQGGYSRFFSITSMLFPMGSLIGPLLSGALTVRFNYSVMNDVLGNYALFRFCNPSISPFDHRKRIIANFKLLFSYFEFHQLYDHCFLCWTQENRGIS